MHARAWVLLLFCLLCSSCKPAPFKRLPLVAADGTLTNDGKPLTGVVVRFYFPKPPFTEEGRGATNSKGEFTVTHKSGDPGLLPGLYRITVHRRVMPGGRVVQDLTQGAEEMPQFLTDPATSGLEVKIDKGGAFELKLTGI